VRKVKAEDIY